MLCPTLVTPWTTAFQAPLSMGLFQVRILKWVEISFSRGFPDTGIKSQSPAVQVDSLLTELSGKPNLLISK